MEETSASGSPAPTPMESAETSVAPVQPLAQVRPQDTMVKDDQWRAMKRVVDNIYAHREPDGHDPSKVFHRKVNKRAMPDYYEVIKEPVALSTLKAKLLGREYRSVAEFVRDCALITHNAQTYNRPEAGAYQDAIIVRGLMEKELQQLAEQKVISSEGATLPDLGEIPPASPRPLEDEEDEDDEDDEDDDDDDADDSDEDGVKRKRKRGPRASNMKRDGGVKGDGEKGNDADSRKRRGRPPRVDTPMEARIKAVLKGIRKHKNDLGQIMIHQFEKLPDKATMPEYYQEVKEPIAIELIKRKQKRKKYQSVDHFMRDIDTMFNNAKSYNQDESQIYKEAVYLQNEAHKLADLEKQKPDTDYVMEEGRLPLPNGILHNNELWKVGDWVHIQNPNDVTKPIVAQIYRTWQDTDGQKWVNACWYYRPEQTVHQYEKHFYPNEVVKTGQYRDHQIDEIIDRCFVMFTTRYSRGRPRGFPADKEVYVCDSRYNEEKHKLNKIKTWASCLPDEVRDKDYEMDLFDGLKRVKKIASPILHMLKEDAKETDEMPKPSWGIENAPPIVGAVYKGARDENQSPPPEPTPSPPPQPPPPAARQISNISTHDNPSTYRRNSEVDVAMGGVTTPASISAPSPSHSSQAQSHTQPHIQQYHQHSASPAPVHPSQYAQHNSSSYAQTHHTTHATSHHTSHHDHYSTPQSRYANPQSSHRTGAHSGIGINPPRPIEVYHLSDSANASIPEDIREQFQRDEQGHVLFFTAPPLDVLPPTKPGAALGHTARYLAKKLRRKVALKEKRKAEGLPENGEESVKKKPRHGDADPLLIAQVGEMRDKAIEIWVKQMERSTEKIYQDIYGDQWEEGMKYEQEKLAGEQRERRLKQAQWEESARKRKEKEKVSLTGTGVYLDDFDPRWKYMDDLPDLVLSPSKAAQAAELSLAWSEITHFLTPLFHPHPIPPFERNPATLNALLQLSTHCSAQTDHNALLASTRALALEELQSALFSTTTTNTTNSTNSTTADNSNPYDTDNSDPTIAILLSIASSLPSEAHTALNTLSSLPSALKSIHPHTPETMALSLSHLTRSESETAQQLARVESLHQQLKSEHVLAQELLDKLRRESNSSTSTGASSRETSSAGSAAPLQTPGGLVNKTGEWQRGSKQLGAKLGEYRERARRLEKSNPSIASNSNPNHHHPHGNAKSGTHGSIGLGELRVEERELRDLEARVRGLEGRVRGFEGLPPDKEMALLEVERMRRELEGLVRKRDGMFEGLIERGE